MFRIKANCMRVDGIQGVQDGLDESLALRIHIVNHSIRCDACPHLNEIWQNDLKEGKEYGKLFMID